jgi:hypothetical protein
MLDQRDDFERSPDAPVLTAIALAAMSIFCLKAYLGVGKYVLDFIMNIFFGLAAILSLSYQFWPSSFLGAHGL